MAKLKHKGDHFTVEEIEALLQVLTSDQHDTAVINMIEVLGIEATGDERRGAYRDYALGIVSRLLYAGQGAAEAFYAR